MDDTATEETCTTCRRRFALTPENAALCLGTDPAVLCPPCADTAQQLRHLRSIARDAIDQLQPALPLTA